MRNITARCTWQCQAAAWLHATRKGERERFLQSFLSSFTSFWEPGRSLNEFPALVSMYKYYIPLALGHTGLYTTRMYFLGLRPSKYILLVVYKPVIFTHPECSLKIFSPRHRPALVWREFHWVGHPGTSVDSVWKRGSLAFFPSFYNTFILSAAHWESGSVIWLESDQAQ